MTLKAAVTTVRGKIRETLFPEFEELRDQLRIERAKNAALEARVRWFLEQHDAMMKQTVREAKWQR
jgi:hypothetical protein